MNRLKSAAVLAVVLLVIGLAVALSWHDDRQAGPMFGATARSSHWPAVRAAHLAKHPACEVCGRTDDIEVHHCLPFHERPELELDPDNLISLCRRDHLVFGHLGSYHSWNPAVRKDAAEWKKRFAERP